MRSPTRCAAKLKSTKVGDPRQEDTRMGPLVTRGQQAAAFDGIRRLASEAVVVCGGADAPALDGIDAGKSAFVAPTLLQASRTPAAPRPCTRSRCSARPRPSCPIATSATLARSIARGGGSLVASVYGEDKDFSARGS